MKRGLTVAVAGAAIVVAGISGCSSNKSSSGGVATSVSGGSVSVGGATASKVIIDGKDQNVQGTAVCSKTPGNITIAVGGASTGYSVVLTDANPPQVKTVALGNVNGVNLGYAQGSGQGNASVTKDGNTYKVTGSATGVDMANPTQPVNKSFEIDATCS